MTTTISMASGYSLATQGAKHVIDKTRPLILDAVDALPLDGADRALTLCDFGCADGGTALETTTEAVRRLRARAPDRPVRVVYCDQPFNDYNALFATVQGPGGRATALRQLDGVFVFAAATSFYEPVLPPGSLHLGLSFTAMHWLSRKPCDIPDHVQAVGARGPERDAFAAQGRSDWQTILLARATELAAGGRLVTANFCIDEQGRYLGHTGGVDMFDRFDTIWRGFLADGDITEAEYRGMTLPQYYKTLPEYVAPLTDPADPVHRAGLRLVESRTEVTPCPYRASFAEHGDAARFAREYVPTLRSWTESTFFGGLDPARPEAERRALIDRYYATYQSRVAADPDGHAMDYVHAFIVIEKAGAPAAAG